MIVYAVLCFISVSVAKEFNLDFTEKGKSFTEKILIDKGNDLMEVDVPAHVGVMESKYLFDYKMRLSVLKHPGLKKCYVQDLPDDEPTIEEMEAGLENTNYVFPTDKYMVQTRNLLPIEEIEPSTLSTSIRDFCGAFQILKVIESDEEGMEKLALEEGRALINGIYKRGHMSSKIVRVCEKRDTEAELKKCMGYPDMLEINCKTLSSKCCIWEAKCKRKPELDFNWGCEYKHAWSDIHCCEWKCLKK